MVSFTGSSERLAAEPVYSNTALASISNRGRKHRVQEHRVTLPVPLNTAHLCFSHLKYSEKLYLSYLVYAAVLKEAKVLRCEPLVGVVS